MLIYLTKWLSNFGSAFRVFEYISFRALLTCLLSLGISIGIGNKLICMLQQLKIGQVVRNNGPKTHIKQKSGTPTMGGILIIASTTISVLIMNDLSNLYVWILLFVMISIGLLGFYDDYLKIIHRNSSGVSGKSKLIIQTIVALLVCFLLFKNTIFSNTLEYGQQQIYQYLTIPIFQSINYPLGLIGFILFSCFVIVGSSNAVNLTDGLDGLVTFPIVTVTIGLGIFAYIAGNKVFAHYLMLPHVVGSQELVIFCSAIVGSCLGFLWFNAYPAKIFMGDVGSLSLGATLGVMAIIVRQEFAFAILSGLFILEALSVIIQVYGYKTTRKRFFLMAPIHHHFELKGIQENQLVVRFWIISIVLLLIGLSTLKIR